MAAILGLQPLNSFRLNDDISIELDDFAGAAWIVMLGFSRDADIGAGQ